MMEDIPHWLLRGKGRAVKDGVNASMQSSRETCSMSAQIVKEGSGPQHFSI